MINKKIFPLAVIFASASLTIMAGSIITPVLNIMRDSLGADPSSVGTIITTHGLFIAIFSPLAGMVIDRAGPRRPYITALIFYGLTGGSGLLIKSFVGLLISRACFGVALAFIFTANNVLILNMYEGTERDRVMGWRGTAQSFGGAVWPLLGGLLGAVSWRLPFAVYLLGIPIGISAIFAIPESKVSSRQTMTSGKTMSVFDIVRNRPVILIINGLILTGNILLYAIVVFLPQFLEQFGITDPTHIGMFITAMTASAGITSFVYGKIRSRFTYNRIVTTSALLWAVVFTIICVAPCTPVIAIGASIFGISQGLMMPTVMVWIGEVVPPSFRGRFSSYLGTFGFIGQFLSPILFAPVFIICGIREIFFICALIGIVWFLFLSLGRKSADE